MRRFCLSLLMIVLVSACSSPADVLDNIGDVSVPDQLSGCVDRSADGTCRKAVCVADEETDCRSWAKACEKNGHIADVREGHDTCARREAESES